jgi:hypothetical protein
MLGQNEIYRSYSNLRINCCIRKRIMKLLLNVLRLYWNENMINLYGKENVKNVKLRLLIKKRKKKKQWVREREREREREI